MTHLQGACSYTHARRRRRFNVCRVFFLNNPPALWQSRWKAPSQPSHSTASRSSVHPHTRHAFDLRLKPPGVPTDAFPFATSNVFTAAAFLRSAMTDALVQGQVTRPLAVCS